MHPWCEISSKGESMASINDKVISEISENDIRYIETLGKNAAIASRHLRLASTEQKNTALENLIQLIEENHSEIQKTNAIDVENAGMNGLSDAMIDRLILNEKTISSMIQSLRDIIALKDPVGEIDEGWVLPNGIKITKQRIPIGVVAIIYESRPNVTIDVGALGLKSSNAVILRGGKEAIESNKMLNHLFQKALRTAGLNSYSIQLIEKTDRKLMTFLMRQKDFIDLIVPRGGEGLIRFVFENSLIPVVAHDKGVVHYYIHKSAKEEIVNEIILNAKTQRPGVCNAVETILIDPEYPDIAGMLHTLKDKGVKFYGDVRTQERLKNMALDEISVNDLTEEGYHKEYLSLDVSLKIVDSLEAAIEHIYTYTSYHSEAILAEDYSIIEKFVSSLDSAAIFVNTSTRFHDGGQFGLGAEVGISTGKLHARGPMGLKDLTTIKYVVRGEGQIRK